jgi:protein-tyrosine phosphatase
LRPRTAAAVTAAAIAAGGLLLGTGPAGPAAAATPAAAQHAARAAGAQPAAAQHPVHAAIPFTAATVTEQSDGGYRISWTAPDTRGLTVYAGRSPHAIDYTHPVAHSAGGSGTVTTSGLGSADRWWFRLVPSRGEGLTLADRSLHLASAPNFRDAGGYRTADGHWVRMGVVYRSGDLSKLTADDLAKLHRLGIRTVYDLRTDGERKQSPDRVPVGAGYLQENVLGSDGSVTDLPSTEAEAVQWMTSAEATMVDADTAKAAYHNVFSGLSGTEPLPAVYHCTAGKDRTGWASAVLLTALGVPRSTVDSDYLASDHYNAASNAAVLAAVPPAQRPVYEVLLTVRQSYLDNGFSEVRKQYGSFGGYLQKGLGLNRADLARLRAELLVG